MHLCTCVRARLCLSVKELLQRACDVVADAEHCHFGVLPTLSKCQVYDSVGNPMGVRGAL